MLISRPILRLALPLLLKPLQNGLSWLVGDGTSIKICNDNWGFEGLNGDSLCPTLLSNNERLVSELWNHNFTGWNKERIKELFGSTIGDQVCNLPIIANGLKDSMVWFHNLHGFYTSKLAYSWLLLQKLGFGPHRFYWKAIWKMKNLPKIRVFCWRVGHDILPTYANISTIRKNFNKVYPQCGKEEETLIHTLNDCPKARAILPFGGLDNKLLERDYSCCIDWIEDIIRTLDMKAVVDFFTILWNSWNNMNNFIFRGQDEDAKTVWERAKTLFHDFRIHNLMGYGVIVMDADDFVPSRSGGFKEAVMDIEWAKLTAFEERVNVAGELNILKVVFESDCASLVNRIKKKGRDITILGHCVDKSCMNLDNFILVEVKWANWSCNKVADLI
ncbi:hypothetical protein Godav_025449 [Gossypium davidsonii]|uniref:Reverse transcriptase zinc-binding domain-containing protein n=3 Tax=Gossypium TaxID=3633 RepID=A0A7J8TD70_GOSDV|nr:hypothetical protein [Gossypium davidsonii]